MCEIGKFITAPLYLADKYNGLKFIALLIQKLTFLLVLSLFLSSPPTL